MFVLECHRSLCVYSYLKMAAFLLNSSSCVAFREEDKNIFDYCRENNIENVRKAISSQKLDVNTKDEEVQHQEICLICSGLHVRASIKRRVFMEHYLLPQ